MQSRATKKACCLNDRIDMLQRSTCNKFYAKLFRRAYEGNNARYIWLGATMAPWYPATALFTPHKVSDGYFRDSFLL